MDYISEICEKCRDKDYSFGWKNCGTMLSFNGTSPNNISMLYRDDIEYWDPLLSRNIHICVLQQRKKEKGEMEK